MKHVAVNTRLLLPGKLEGISRFAFEVLSRMVKAHPEVAFSFFFDRAFDSAYLFGDNVKPYIIPPQSRHPILWYAWFHHMLPRKLEQLKPDVFFSPEFYLSTHPTIPQVSVIHDLAYEHFPKDIGKLAAWYCRKYSPKYTEAAKHVLTVSEFSKQDIVQLYGTAPEKITVAYNAAGNQFVPVEKSKQQEIRNTFSQGQPYFHFVGTIQPRKNIENLLMAFDLFKKNFPNPLQLLLVGRKGWKYEAALQAYEQMTHKEAVHFTGFVSDQELSQIYAASNGLCYIPYLEGFGIPLVEAMQTETPIICSNISSLPEVAGQAALQVSPDDLKGISQAMYKLWSDQKFAKSLVQEGRNQREKFSWDLSAKKIWEVLEKASHKVSS